jgi:NADH:ubiquinone oxidoreductase subunit 4 (subunit M)
MLRAYRKIFMGQLGERWKGVVDLRLALRLPVTLLVGALLFYGFFPQAFVRMIVPAFRSYLTANK